MRKQKKKSIVEQISTLPSTGSVKWAGQQRSILSSVLLWTLWLCRVLSLLQIGKLLFRKIVIRLKRGTVDGKSTRVNVPPAFCEIYFICWFAVMLLAYCFHASGVVINVITYYFLFESVVWVLYYTIFRRFFEENYSIYHELEYLTVLVLLIPSQALALANLYGAPFSEIVSGLLGAGNDATPVSVRILGAMFAAIVISMIISSFPTEKVKKKIEKPHMYVIGCGDVVQKRLYPALRKSGCSVSDIDVYDLVSVDDPVDYCTYCQDSDDVINRIDDELDTHDIVWIETPADVHVSYLRELIDSRATMVVVEKPITTNREELSYVRELTLSEATRSRVFFLSYYMIEKAIALHMLSEYNPSYEKYLDMDDIWLVKNARQQLGALLSAEVTLLEGEDERSWAFDGANGGQLMETFIHNVLIATLFTRMPSEWENVAYEHDTNRISLTAKSGRADIRLLMKKNLPADQVSRSARFEFAGGYILADFDRQSAEVYLKEVDRICRVTVKERFHYKYGIMVDLVKRVEKGECRSFEVDGLKNQLGVTQWLIDLEDRS